MESKLDAVKQLREYDHCFLSEEGIGDFNKAFGVDIPPYMATANPNHPKGLTFNDGSKSSPGYDAASYAEEVCRLVGSPFCPWQLGRGSRLRSACNALEEYFKAK